MNPEIIPLDSGQVPLDDQASRTGAGLKWCKACMDLECYVYVPYPCFNGATGAGAQEIVDASSAETDGSVAWTYH